MNETELKYLIGQYQSGRISQEEWQKLEEAIAQGRLDPGEIPVLNEINYTIDRMEDPNPPVLVKEKVFEMIENENRLLDQDRIWIHREWLIRSVLAAAAMLTGILAGYHLPWRNAPSGDVEVLRGEVAALKETMLLTLIEKETTTDRLRAVSYSYELDQSSRKVIEALLTTLNEDNNINVRLAAVEALQRYGSEDWVRTQLVKSISRQESPLVQMALAECMVALNEKTSVQELQKLINREETPEAVKDKLKAYIRQII